jgi:hypothetical protein
VIALSASQSGADHADPAVRRTALRGARMLIEVFDLPAARPAVPQWTRWSRPALLEAAD